MSEKSNTCENRLQLVESPGPREHEKKLAPEPAWLQGRREYQWFHENRARIEELIKVLQ